MIHRCSLIPQDDPKQAQRIMRLIMAFSPYLLAGLIGLITFSLGYLPLSIYLFFTGLVFLVNGFFYVIIRSGANLKFRDPSLTQLQIIAGIVQLIGISYFAGPARGVFLMFSIVVFLFGVFRLGLRQFIVASLAMSLGYGGVCVLLSLNRPESLNARFEFLQWICFSLVLSQVVMVGSHIGKLREKLRRKNNELDQAVRTIEEMATHDELTGVHNRRYLMAMLRQEKLRCDRGAAPCSVCLIDVDFFKRINDNFGHPAGDEVLRGIAESSALLLRANDYFGRFGGEEFALVLPQTTQEKATVVAERMRALVQDLRFANIAPDLQVTISIGMTEYQPNEEIDKTLGRADAALSRAKKGGRNRVVVWEETEVPLARLA